MWVQAQGSIPRCFCHYMQPSGLPFCQQRTVYRILGLDNKVNNNLVRHYFILFILLFRDKTVHVVDCTALPRLLLSTDSTKKTPSRPIPTTRIFTLVLQQPSFINT